MKRILFLSIVLLAGSAEARVKNADLYTLYDVVRNSRAVIQGTVTDIDVGRKVVTVKVDRLWHGQIPPEAGGPDEAKYEIRGQLDAYRVGRTLIEFLDPNLPYGTQDPKTIMAPLKPRSPRNRVLLGDPEQETYARFVNRYLEITAGDRGATWSRPLHDYLLESLGSEDSAVRSAAGNSLSELLTLSDRAGKSIADLLTQADLEILADVLMKAETPGPGASLMKVLMDVGVPSLAAPLIHGGLYMFQSGIEARDAFLKALILAPQAANEAIRREYADAEVDQFRENIIQTMTHIGGEHGEAFLWETIEGEDNRFLRRSAISAYICVEQRGSWTKLAGVYAKEPEERKLEMLSRIARCRGHVGEVQEFLKGEMKAKAPSIRNLAAIECAQLQFAEALPLLEEMLGPCCPQESPGLDCLQAMDGLRALASPESIQALERFATNADCSERVRQDAAGYLEGIRRVTTP